MVSLCIFCHRKSGTNNVIYINCRNMSTAGQIRYWKLIDGLE